MGRVIKDGGLRCVTKMSVVRIREEFCLVELKYRRSDQ